MKQRAPASYDGKFHHSSSRDGLKKSYVAFHSKFKLYFCRTIINLSFLERLQIRALGDVLALSVSQIVTCNELGLWKLITWFGNNQAVFLSLCIRYGPKFR